MYHAHANPTVFNEDRVIRMQPFEFRSDGTPNFGTPITPGVQLSVPAKGADAERPIWSAIIRPTAWSTRWTTTCGEQPSARLCSWFGRRR